MCKFFKEATMNTPISPSLNKLSLHAKLSYYAINSCHHHFYPNLNSKPIKSISQISLDIYYIYFIDDKSLKVNVAKNYILSTKTIRFVASSNRTINNQGTKSPLMTITVQQRQIKLRKTFSRSSLFYAIVITWEPKHIQSKAH